MSELLKLRYPNLRAFQLRNMVNMHCKLPPSLYLLESYDDSRQDSVFKRNGGLCINFLHEHAKICCLAWPIDRFFCGHPVSDRPSDRAAEVIDNLASSLVQLRVDKSCEHGSGGQTDRTDYQEDIEARLSRRRFISDFVARLQKIEVLKIEGGIPRDELREIIRAVGACPLRELVILGTQCPIGNTWGYMGCDIEEPEHAALLEMEDMDAITRLGAVTPIRPSSTQKFEAEYGWPPSPPLLHTIAAYHADTITRLKLGGGLGAPVLWDPTPITTPMLAPLRHFHRLCSLVLPFFLQTFYEDHRRDKEIIGYWFDSCNPTSTALVVPSTDQMPLSGWAKRLATEYAPDKIAQRIATFIGPFLSERAKAQPGGISVRGGIAMGKVLFDWDIVLDKAPDGQDRLVSWKGPRSSMHPERRREKLEKRRWF
ncbi:hypothetical protein MBLNU459_g6620t1 [Dothideomycetes sp. NU459]